MDEVNTVLERMKARCDSRGYRVSGTIPENTTWEGIAQLLRPGGQRRTSTQMDKHRTAARFPPQRSHHSGSWPRNRPEEAAYGIMMDTRERIMSLEANDPSAEGGQYRSTYLQVAKAHQELLHTLQGFHTRSRPAGVQTGTEATTPLLEITEELGDLPNDIEFSFNAPPSSRREYPPRNLWSRQESGDQSPCCGGASSSAGLSVITATTEDQYEGVAEASVANALVADLLANTMSTLTPIDENIQDRSTSDGVEALSEEGTILNGEGASNIKTRGVQGISESPHEYDNEDSTQPPEGGVAGGTPVSEEGLRLKELGRGRTREDVEGASARGGGITTGEEDDHLLNGCLMAVGGGDEPREDNHFDEGGMMRGFDHDREIALAVLAEHYDRIDKARPVGEDQIGDGVAMTIGEYHPDTVLFEAEDRVVARELASEEDHLAGESVRYGNRLGLPTDQQALDPPQGPMDTESIQTQPVTEALTVNTNDNNTDSSSSRVGMMMMSTEVAANGWGETGRRPVAKGLGIAEKFDKLVQQARANTRSPLRTGGGGGRGRDIPGTTNFYLPNFVPRGRKTVEVRVSKNRLLASSDSKHRDVFDADPF